MKKIILKRVYETPEKTDGYRVIVDGLWPRGMKKESIEYDYWAKELAPSSQLRKWYHSDKDANWPRFRSEYIKELKSSRHVKEFIEKVREYPTVTLLYAAKDTVHNHAVVLADFLHKSSK